MEKREALNKIREIRNVNERAKRQMEALVEFCTAMGGEVKEVKPPVVFIGYGFSRSRVSCRIPKPIIAQKIKRESDSLDIVTKEEWHTLNLSGIEPSEFVVYEDFERKPHKLTYYYLEKTGVDEIKGEIPIGGFSATVENYGRTINIALLV